MTDLPDIKQKVVTTFPASIFSGVGVTVSKANGAYTFKLDYTGIGQAAAIPAPDYTSTWQLFWNSVDNRFTLVPYALPTVAVVGTSTTSVSIGSGTKNFTVESGLGWITGMRLHAAYNDDTDQFVEGKIISYDPGTGALSLDVDTFVGSGTYASWSLGVAGNKPIEPYDYLVSTATDSVAIGTGSKSFTVEPGRGWIEGMRLHVSYDGDNYMEGSIASYDGVSGALTVTVDTIGGSGTYSAWNIGVAGISPLTPFNYVQEPVSVTGSTKTVDGLTTTIAIERTSPTATTITLPPVADQFNSEGYGVPLRIVDWSSSVSRHVITITPDGSETIMTAATLELVSTALNLAAVTLYPSTDLSGWYAA